MVRRRDITRREARSKRVVEDERLAQRMHASRERAALALARMSSIAADHEFTEMLLRRGIGNVPTILTKGWDESIDGVDHSVSFLIAWKFFYPLLLDHDLVGFMGTRWPDFVSEIKDAFISQVMDGPNQA